MQPTTTVVLGNPYKEGYIFDGWYAAADFSGAKVTEVNATSVGTLYAKWSVAPIYYELNGGVWNKYGWTSKKDMYDAFVAEWKVYSDSRQSFCSYETQLGIGNSNQGLPTAILSTQPILEFMAQDKWAWLGQFLDALATAQSKVTKPTEAVLQMRYGLGNFFGEDSNGASNWIGAVDCSAGQANPEAFQPTWGQSLPHPIQPTTTVVLGNPYKEGYLFDGWYATSDFSGAEVTTVDESTTGTLYAKWTEKVIIIDENADNTTALAPFVGETVTATVVRNFTPNGVFTLTLPFDMNDTQISTIFGNATVYEFAKVVDDEYEIHLQFSSTRSISAGKPYILVTPTSGGYDAEDGFTIEGVTINTTPNPVTISPITMQPILDAGGTLDQSNQYYLSGGGLYNAGTHNMEKVGLRAYFESTSPLPVRARVVFQDNEATSIPMVEAQSENNVRKVMKNGQLIIIRGEQKYNVQGQRME